MAEWIYSLCALTSLLCAALLLRAYLQRRYRLLLWSALCFCGLALNNTLLVVDKLFLPDVDLAIPRSSVALIAMAVLIFGLINDQS